MMKKILSIFAMVSLVSFASYADEAEQLVQEEQIEQTLFAANDKAPAATPADKKADADDADDMDDEDDEDEDETSAKDKKLFATCDDEVRIQPVEETACDCCGRDRDAKLLVTNDEEKVELDDQVVEIAGCPCKDKDKEKKNEKLAQMTEEEVVEEEVKFATSGTVEEEQVEVEETIAHHGVDDEHQVMEETEEKLASCPNCPVEETEETALEDSCSKVA